VNTGDEITIGDIEFKLNRK